MEAVQFGEYLRSLRLNKKMTIRQLELYSGVSNAYLSQLENGKRGIPSPDIIRKLSGPLDISYWDLMHYAGHLSSEEEQRKYNEYLYDLVKKDQEKSSMSSTLEKMKNSDALQEQSASNQKNGGLAYYGGPDRYTDEEKASSAAKRKAIMEKYPAPTPLAFIQFSDGSIEELTPDEEGHMDKQLKMYRLLKEQEDK